MSPAPLLSVRGIAKRFGALTALTGVDLDIRAGEVLALLGDNGAGKSTFVKILAGAQSPSEGEIRIDDTPIAFASPQDAAAAGIATIFQELALSENLSIAENVFLGRELVRRVAGIPFLQRRAMKRRVITLLTELDAHISDPEAPVGSLSGGQRQAVAICRALNVNARLVIMDEPTAALAVAETRKVLAGRHRRAAADPRAARGPSFFPPARADDASKIDPYDLARSDRPCGGGRRTAPHGPAVRPHRLRVGHEV